MVNFGDWLSSAERIYKSAGGFGFTFAVISLPVVVGFELGFLDRTMFGGAPYHAAHLLLWLSIGVLFLSVVTNSLKATKAGFYRVNAYIRKRKSDKIELQKLVQNVELIDPQTCLRLWTFMARPSGRFVCDGYNLAIRQLLRSGLILRESGTGDVAFVGEFMKVSELGMKDVVRAAVEARVERDYPNATKDSNRLWTALQSLPRQYLGR